MGRVSIICCLNVDWVTCGEVVDNKWELYGENVDFYRHISHILSVTQRESSTELFPDSMLFNIKATLFNVHICTYLHPGFVQHRPNTISKEDHTSVLSIILGIMWVIWIYATNEKETVEEAAVFCLHLIPIELVRKSRAFSWLLKACAQLKPKNIRPTFTDWLILLRLLRWQTVRSGPVLLSQNMDRSQNLNHVL